MVVQLTRRMRLVAFLVAGVLATVVLVVFPSATLSASAAPNGTPCTGCSAQQNGPGYNVTAAVHFSGDAAPGGGGTVSMGVPAACWWTANSQVPADPTKWVDWYLNYVTGLGPSSTNVGYYWQAGTEDMWRAAAARAAAGEALQVYTAQCRDSGDLCQLNAFTGNPAQGVGPMGGACGVSAIAGFFPPGNPPAPLVKPEDLAKLARDNMVIDAPNIDRNPKVGAVGQGTLVGLPTWFWVTNPAAVGGANGTRTIRAEVGAVFAQVVAKTDGLTVTSPAGGTSCPPTVATRAYSAGASDSSGCTVAFAKASVGYAGGYPVDASTAWAATWTGSGGTGGNLEGLARNTQVQVPVAESQALVNGS